VPARPLALIDTQARRIVDPARGMAMDVTIRKPAEAVGPLPVVIYSVPMDWPPADPTPDGAHIAEHLAAFGYLAITVRHPGTDRLVFPEYPSERRDKASYALDRTEDPACHLYRIADFGFLLDTLEAWNDAGPFKGQIDLARIGLSGHSFGGLTGMALIGQRVGDDLVSWKDARIKAIVTYGVMASPPGAPGGMFSDIDRPHLSIVGAGDFTYGRWYMPSDKLAAFRCCDAPHRYAVMLDLADHHTYHGGRTMVGKATNGELLCQQWTRCLALAFWDAWLCGDPAARRWLDEDLAGLIAGDGRFWRK
jgi:dienelactone hydrolase